MRVSKLFSITLREVPSEAEVASHQLLIRAGFIRQLGVGIYAHLPLAQGVLTRIENIIREEMALIGGQEIKMPVMYPADVCRDTGRWDLFGAEMDRIKDVDSHNMVLTSHIPSAARSSAGVTHARVVATLAKRVIRSYKQLPQTIYHIQAKFREDPRPRVGLIQPREFIMLNSYSLDRDRAGLASQYQAHYEAYFRIFNRCGLTIRAVVSDSGMPGDSEAHQFVYLTPVGEDTLLFCVGCDYAVNRQVASFKKPVSRAEARLPLEKVATPGATTIAALSKYLDILPEKTAKAVLLMGQMAESALPRMIFAVMRGDMTLNETKLVNAISAAGLGVITHLRPAKDSEIIAIGAYPGYASPMGIDREKVWVVVDDLLLRSPNLVAGANEPGYHLRNSNLGRDYQADVLADIVFVEDGMPCPLCGGLLKAHRGVAVGNIFKLGSRYTDTMGASYLDEDGQPQSILMGSYGIDLDRLIACVAEEHHDAQGLIWPETLTPYPVHLVALGSRDGSVERAAEAFYQSLIGADLEPLYDDRNERAGVKFNDADLIGIPLRVTISTRSLQSGGFEFKRRGQEERWIVPVEEAIDTIKKGVWKPSK